MKGGVEPEDIVQETLLAIHLKPHTWAPDAAVRPWVYAIVRFKLVDAFRRRGGRVEVVLDHMADTFAEAENISASDRDRGRKLGVLPPRHRQVVSTI